MSATDLFVNFFVALFALIDPIGNVPVFAAATAGALASGRRMVALYICIFAFLFLAFFYFTGLTLLEFFGISLAAFRIAGGVILFLLGLDMARDEGRLPEVRDFPAWRRELAEWFTAGAAQEEAWTLSDGTHLRIVAQPMPDALRNLVI